MGLIMQNGEFVGRDEIARVDTPQGTASWKPVPHIDVIDAVTEVIEASQWSITDERFGLASDGKKLFGVMTINRTSCPEWTRCIGLRNSHDKSFAVGLTAGITVLVCSNLAFGGGTVIRRKHTSRLELTELVEIAMNELEDQFLTLETAAETLKVQYLKDDDEARSAIVRAAEIGVINSSDILPVWREYKTPRHDEFSEPTRWSLLNAFTEIVKKYTPARSDQAYSALNTAFGMDGNRPRLWEAV